MRAIGEEEKRQRAEEALRESELKYRSLFDNSKDAILLTIPDGTILAANPEACRMFGRTEREICRIGGNGLIDSSDPRLKKALEQRKVTGEFSGELTFIRSDGTRFPGDLSSKVFSDKDGQARTSMIIRDITERKLKEKDYQNIIHTTTDGFWIVDSAGRFLDVNDAYCALVGYSREELLNMRITDIEAVEKPEDTARRIRRIIKTGHDRFETRHRCKDGRIVDIEVSTTYAGAGDGRLFVFIRDITERKKAEEKLRDETTRHHILIDESSDGIVILDESGGVYGANRRFAEMLGYTPEEVRELHLWDWDAHFKREQLDEMVASVGPEGDHFETQHRRKDGTIFDVEISTNGAVYAGQKLIFCVCRDVTARKQAEAALKESEEKYKTLAEATSDIIWEADEKGTFTFVSPKIKDVLGYEVNEVVGKMRTLDLIPKVEARKWLKKFKEVNAKRTPFFGFEIAHLHKNGTYVIFETSGIPLFDSAGNLKGFVGINKDITERRQMQEQMVIADRLASVGELAAGIAHELNNPLTGVIGFSQLLLDKEMPDDVRQDMQVVHNEAQRAAQVVKNLLTFARKHTAAKEKVNINDIINKVLELRAYEQKLESITVDARLDANLPEVMADYFQLQQVFLNIVINAEYFMKEANHKGNLTITTEKVGNKIRASFADDGPGIADENLGHLFDPFFTTKEVGRGTGLGLSICHGIVAEHGGRIYVESEMGKGTAFIVELAIGAAERKGGAA